MHNRTKLVLRSLALGTLSIFALPVACIYPEYTFNEPEPTNSGGSGGQGGAPGVEDCQNGKDDDGDGQADCGDDDCTTIYSCVPGPPPGWEGYISLFDGLEADKPGACPGAFPTVFNGHRNLLTPAHTCSSCSCDAPTGQTCDLPDQLTVSNKNCGFVGTTSPLPVPADWIGDCHGPAGLQGGLMCAGGACNSSVSMAKPVVTGGNCPAQGGTVDKQPEQWEFFGFGCLGALQGGGCGSGSVCQPKSAAPFRTGLCIYKTGENACPVGAFSEHFVYYDKVQDTRGCSTCECDAPAGSTCDATIKVYSDVAVNMCTTEIASFPAGSCANLMNNPAVFGRSAVITPPSGGSCNVKPGGGQVMGALTPVDPTTICCIP